MAKIPLSATIDASIRTDISDTTYVIATRSILGKDVTFLSNGEHVVDGVGMSPEEMQHSELLRFAHASVLISQPVGNKDILWVDASRQNVEVWVYGRRVDRFIKEAKSVVDPRIVMDGSLIEVRKAI